MRTVISGFSGAVPRATQYGLPDNVAVYATNAKLVSGEVRGLHTLTLLKDFLDTTVKSAFRIPDAPNPDVWLKFTTLDAVVIRSPVVNDAYSRYYWHEPGQPMMYNTLARIKAGNPAYLVGVPQPTNVPTVVGSGGSGTQVERSYTYTFVSAYGEEGPPANPSPVTTYYDNGTWTIGNLDTTVPNPTQRNIVSKNIYRTVVSATGTATFYFVANVPLATASYADTQLDLTIASQATPLQSSFWYPPPSDMQGIVSFPGGIVLGWKDNTVYMSVPFRPWAWPSIYQLSVEQPVVGIGVSANTAVVGTQGQPYAITMTTPDAAALQKIEAPEPCLSRGSVIGSPEGVFYASQNGLMLFSASGFQNVSRQLVTKEEWLQDYSPTSLRACRYQTNYIGITAPGTGYIIDAEVQPMTLTELTELSGAINIFNDIWTGEVYLLANGRVWKWDDPLTPEVVWRWASKRFFLPYEVNFAVARIGTKKEFYRGLAARPPAEKINTIYRPGSGSTGAPPKLIPSLPPWAAFTLNVYADGALVQTRHVTSPDTIKLLDGLKSQDWQFEIIGRCPMAKFEFAESAKELAQV